MRTLYYGILQQKSGGITGITYTIDTSYNSMNADWNALSYTPYNTITTTPDMTTTITKIDTGDGTSWANAYPNNGSGDYQFRARMMDENTTGSPRSMTLRIEDVTRLETDKDVILTQLANPE